MGLILLTEDHSPLVFFVFCHVTSLIHFSVMDCEENLFKAGEQIQFTYYTSVFSNVQQQQYDIDTLTHSLAAAGNSIYKHFCELFVLSERQQLVGCIGVWCQCSGSVCSG